MLSVRPATSDDVDACVAVLVGLPDHFTPDTHDQLRHAMSVHPAWVATATDSDPGVGEVVGVVVAERRYERSAEITFAAVRPERHGHGVGTALVERAITDLRADGVEIVEAKTLDASSGYEPYIATRAFWEARGFVQIDCIDPLPGWQPGNPSAIYVRPIVPSD